MNGVKCYLVDCSSHYAGMTFPLITACDAQAKDIAIDSASRGFNDVTVEHWIDGVMVQIDYYYLREPGQVSVTSELQTDNLEEEQGPELSSDEKEAE